MCVFINWTYRNKKQVNYHNMPILYWYKKEINGENYIIRNSHTKCVTVSGLPL